MTQNNFPIETLLLIVTGCIVNKDQEINALSVVNFICGKVISELNQNILRSCRNEILRQYPGLRSENKFLKYDNKILINSEQKRISNEMKVKFKVDSLSISQMASK